MGYEKLRDKSDDDLLVKPSWALLIQFPTSQKNIAARGLYFLLVMCAQETTVSNGEQSQASEKQRLTWCHHF
jgi:hypothetical protein